VPAWEIVSSFGIEPLVAKQAWPRSLALLEDKLYWGNYRIESAIQETDIEGCRTTTITPRQFQPTSVSTDGRRIFWVQGSGDLMAYDPASARTSLLGRDINPFSGLAFDGDEIYSVGGECVLRVVRPGTTSASPVTAVQAGRGLSARRVGADIFFTCFQPHTMYAFSPTTGFLRTILRRQTRITTFVQTSSTSVAWGEDTCESFFDSCTTLPEPKCCPGRVLVRDFMSGRTATIARDETSSPLSIAANNGVIYWTNFTEVRRANVRSSDNEGELVAAAQGYPEGFVFDGAYVYWVNPNRRGDFILSDGTVVRRALSR